MRKKLGLILIVCLIALFLSRDKILEVAIEKYLERKLEIKPFIERAHLSFRFISLEDFRLLTEGFSLDISTLKFIFDFSLKPQPRFFRVVIKDANLKINNIKKTQQTLKKAFLINSKDRKSDSQFTSQTLTLSLNFKNVKFSMEGEGISFKGLFGGKFFVYVRGGSISALEANFSNAHGGFINIEREASFAFLRRYLEESSYQALIQGFKNYIYNSGQIGLTKKGSILSVNLNFNSKELGKRDIAINLHNI